MLFRSGVDSKRFIPLSTKKKLELKSDLGFPPNKKIVLHVGHLKENRNILQLLPLQTRNDIQVVVIGSTTTKQSESIKNQLHQAGCIVINNYQPAIERFYQAADCYVFPTVDVQACIQLPLSVLEAMATNLPVVTTRFGGLPDIFPSGEGLFYSSLESNDELVSVVLSAISSTVDTRTLVLAFDWLAVTTQLTKLYVELVNG